MAGYSDWGSLKAAILSEISSAMDATLTRAYHDLQMNVVDFYKGGDPLVYIRTLKLAAAPKLKGASGGGNIISGMVYMDQSYSYDTGTWDTPKIMEAAEYGNENLKGVPGFWGHTEADIPEIIESEFGSRFG